MTDTSSASSSASMAQLGRYNVRANHEIIINLEKAKSALEALINDNDDFLCLIDEEGHVIWGNLAAARSLKSDIEYLYKEDLSTLFSEDNWNIFLQNIARVTEGELSERSIEFQLPVDQLQEKREILWTIRPFDMISKRRGNVFQVGGRDITTVLEARSEKVQLENELSTAEIVQSAFFPSQSIKRPDIEIFSFYEPAERCSGDWWGHFNIGEGLELVCIADVMGHGVASALVTAITHSCCMTLSSKYRKDERLPDAPVANIVNQLNEIICDTFRGQYFATFFGALFDMRKGTITYCNAGHNFPLYLKTGINSKQDASKEDKKRESRGRVVSLKDRKNEDIESLALGGNPLGVGSSLPYNEAEIKFNPGDRFVFYTDGILECTNSQLKPFGMRNFRKVLLQNKACDLQTFTDNVIKSGKDFYDGFPLKDDLTFFVLEVLHSWKASETK